MSIVSPPDAVACCRQCKKKFTSSHGSLVHYGQNHERKKAICVTCDEEFPSRKPEQQKQCLDCIRKHGPLNRKT